MFFLAHGVVGALLADVDAFGIAPHQFQNLRGNQVVVDHHVGLLHQAQGAEGEQVRVAGAAADQIDLAAWRGVVGIGCQHLLQYVPCGLVFAPASTISAIGPCNTFSQKMRRLAGSGNAVFDLVAEVLRKVRQASIGGRDEGFQLGAQEACQHRRSAAAGNRDDQRRAVDDGGHDEGAQIRVVHHIDRNPLLFRGYGNLLVGRAVIGGGDDENGCTRCSGRNFSATWVIFPASASSFRVRSARVRPL